MAKVRMSSRGLRHGLRQPLFHASSPSAFAGLKNRGHPEEMKPVEGYFLIAPQDLHWRPSNLMKIPNADFLERTKSENWGARL